MTVSGFTMRRAERQLDQTLESQTQTSRSQDPQSQATVLVHALQQKKLMTECQVLRVQSGPSLKTATKGEEQGSEECQHSIAPYHASPQAQRFQ